MLYEFLAPQLSEPERNSLEAFTMLSEEMPSSIFLQFVFERIASHRDIRRTMDALLQHSTQWLSYHAQIEEICGQHPVRLARVHQALRFIAQLETLGILAPNAFQSVASNFAKLDLEGAAPWKGQHHSDTSLCLPKNSVS